MGRIDRRQFLKAGVVGMAGLMIPWRFEGLAHASSLESQTPLVGSGIPKFVDPLPVFGPATRVTGLSITVSMHEIEQQVLPAAFPKTRVWAYNVGGRGPLYPGVTVEARRGVPTTMTYINALPVSGSMVQRLVTIDQTLHWANPLGLEHMDEERMEPYKGPPPAVVHLHGAEVPSDFDGGPDQWFTPTGLRGKGYRSLSATSENSAIYRYPNEQEAATLWFHDHTLGATRTNVYAGMAAFYLLRDQYDTGLPDNPLRLPAGAQEIELAIQDRQFDTNGQLYFPDGNDLANLNGPPPNPLIHPFWNPEFFGDVMVVNGKSWPYLEVEPRRYRFRMLDGCNARFLKLTLENLATNSKKGVAPIWVIGTEGGLLNTPAKLNDPKAPEDKRQPLLMAPGERYDVIVDFSGFEGQTLTLVNRAKGPFPNGAVVDAQTTGQVMQFKVVKKLSSADTTYNPASGDPLRGGANQMPAIATLPAPVVKRQLTLNEVMGPGGPVEALVNNSRWDGTRDKGHMEEGDPPEPIAGSRLDMGYYLTELPKVGDTELWEVINLTGDTHPIHLHLVQFQIVSRQRFNVSKYTAAYEGAFPGGEYGGADMATGEWMEMDYPPGVAIPAYGPPGNYNVPNADGAIGGNPAIGPYLQGAPVPPGPEEAGWKDTAQMNPGEVTRILVRFAQQDGSPFPFDATGETSYAVDRKGELAQGPGYVWHCHIVDHEDNEMMRPYHPVKE